MNVPNVHFYAIISNVFIAAEILNNASDNVTTYSIRSIVETFCDIQRDLYNATYVMHAKHGQRNAPHLGPKQRCALSTTIPNFALFLKF